MTNKSKVALLAICNRLSEQSREALAFLTAFYKGS